MIELNSKPNIDKLKKICQPLFEKLGINHFFYSTISNEGFFSEVGVHLDWLYHYAENEFFKTNPFKCDPKYIIPGTYIPTNVQIPAFEKIVATSRKLQVHPFLLFIERNSSGTVRYGFNLSYDMTQQDALLMNEISLLRTFVKHFQVEASDILGNMQDNAINIAQEMGDQFHHRPTLPKTKLTLEEKLAALRGFERISPLVPVKFSKREKECILLRLSGKSSRESSELLGLSRRTVENYLENIKGKLNCDDQSSFSEKLEQLRMLGVEQEWSLPKSNLKKE